VAGAKNGRSAPYIKNESDDLTQDKEKMVYVGNLAYEVKWQDLKDHMAQAGQVDFARILTEDGTEWGRSRGTGYVRYATVEDAQAAIATLKETVLKGRNVLVDGWTGSSSPQAAMRKGKGGSKGFGKVSAGKGGGKATPVMGDPKLLVYVGNLSYHVTWQDLKVHMSQAGNVEFAKVLTEDGTDYGRSRGTGCVRYSTEVEVENAISLLGESELKGRSILVDHWTKGLPA